MMIRSVVTKAAVYVFLLCVFPVPGPAAALAARHYANKIKSILSIGTKSPPNVLIKVSSQRATKDGVVLAGRVAFRRPESIERLNGQLDLEVTKGKRVIYVKRRLYMQPRLRYGKLSRPQYEGRRFECTIPWSILGGSPKDKAWLIYRGRLR